MSKLIAFFRDQHPSIFKVFLFIAAVGIIVYIFPREGKFKYEFQKGKPWAHVDLFAPFDFPIYKSDQDIIDEKGYVKSIQLPYFFHNENIAKSAFEQLAENGEKEVNRIIGDKKIENVDDGRARYLLNRAQMILAEIYQKGIVELHESIDGNGDDFKIFVLENNTAIERSLGEFYTIQTAFDALKKRCNDLEENEADLILNLLQDRIKRDIKYDQETNDFTLEQELSKISPTEGLVQRGQLIVSTGEVLHEEEYRIVNSLKIEYEAQMGNASQQWLILLGQVILVALMVLSLALFLYTYRKEIIRSDMRIIFLLTYIVLFVLGAKSSINIENINLYLVPFCMLPLIIRTFFDIRVALFTYLVTILIIGFIAPNPYEFIIIEMIAGILTLFAVPHLRKRSQLFVSAFIIFLVYSTVYLSIGLIQDGSFTETNWRFLGWFLGSALLTLFTYPLIYIFEKIFGFVSDVTLMELSDTNNKLLRKLNLKAPGTFQHSLQVSNLAEEAIRNIGGNPLLVRTGALYHDVGKMSNPNYFIENQNSDYNPHDELDPQESAGIIIDHVISGIELARRNNLPDIIIDFIRTHHGTTRTEYFYRVYKEQKPEINKEETSSFQYPGPIPYSKETAVLMMADSVEAASRSMKNYDGESIENLINSIIDNQIKEGQFERSNITFSDITQIKKMFKKRLMSIYHVRLEYPE